MSGLALGVGRMAARQDEPVLRRKLRELSQRSGVLRDNLYDFLEQELRARWHIDSSDRPETVLVKVIWQLDRLIAQLRQEEHRLAARYAYNITGIEEVERRDLGGRQKELANRREHPHPSARHSRNYMTKVILPQFEASLLSDPPPSAPDEVLAEAAQRLAAGERVTAIMASLASGESPQPPHRRKPRPVPALAGVILVVVLGATAGLALGLTNDDGDGADGLPNDADDQGTPPSTSQPVADGETITEVCGNRDGCRVFENPRQPFRTQPDLEFTQEVEVSCRVYAPSMESVEWWYRLASEPYNNEWWSPAVTFLNGDPVEGPYEHDVDEAVPEC